MQTFFLYAAYRRVTRSLVVPVALTLAYGTMLLRAPVAEAQQSGSTTGKTSPTQKAPDRGSAQGKIASGQSGDAWMWLEAEKARQMAGQFKAMESLESLQALKAMALDQSALARLTDIEAKALSLGAQAGAMAGQKAMVEAQAQAFAYGFGDSFGGYAGAKSGTYGFSYGGNYRTVPPAPWEPQDMADSLYRSARRFLSMDSYALAALTFRKMRADYPKSAYTPDSYYWEAFALQRLAEKGEPNQKASLVGAIELLESQRKNFPKASTRGDASALQTRIEGQLARLGDQNAIEKLSAQAVNATRDGCPREQDDERIDALNALAQMDAEQAAPILKKVLTRREPCTQRLRQTAVWLIASRKLPDAASVLLNVAKTDPDKEVREQAIFWMSNVPTDEAASMLIDLVKKGDDLELRKRAVYSLSRSKSTRAATTLKELALDPNADVDLRGDALMYYMSGPGRADDNQTAFLKDVYGRADDQRFKQRVLQIIASRRSDESRSFLVDVAQNQKESMEIRRSAIWSLQGSGVTAAQLSSIYDRGTDLEVRKQIIGVLASIKDNGGLEKLLDVARNDKNAELRKQAIVYLTRSKDPRAVALLQEIINR